MRLFAMLVPLLMFIVSVDPGTNSTMAKEGGKVGVEVVCKDGKVWLEGMDHYRYMDPMFEGVRIILAARGDEYSPAYIQGISGSAFRIAGICPCAPTSNNAMEADRLVRLLGYELVHLNVVGPTKPLPEEWGAIAQRVRQEIDEGRAALGFHAFTNAEWDVIYGYDSEKRTFLGRGSYAGNDKPYAEAPEDRMMKCRDFIGGTLGAILIGDKIYEFDARKAEFAALKEAVRHARSQMNMDRLAGDKWVGLEGIACYDRWIRDFQDPTRKLSIGDCYCIGVYASTHAAAGPFLREIAPKYQEAHDSLLEAATHFEREAKALGRARSLLWWDSPEGPDAERNAKVVSVLREARDAYAAGIAELEQALNVIPRPEPVL